MSESIYTMPNALLYAYLYSMLCIYLHSHHLHRPCKVVIKMPILQRRALRFSYANCPRSHTRKRQNWNFKAALPHQGAPTSDFSVHIILSRAVLGRESTDGWMGEGWMGGWVEEWVSIRVGRWMDEWVGG